MENLNEAIKLLVIGMLTVYLILLIVIYLGKALIALVNRFAPEEAPTRKQVASQPSQGTVDAQTQTIIQAAVSQLTEGKGKATKITKI